MKDLGSHAWPKAPGAEGYTLSLRAPIAVERSDKMDKAFLAVGLGLINPALAFIPFAVGTCHAALVTQHSSRSTGGVITFPGKL